MLLYLACLLLFCSVVLVVKSVKMVFKVSYVIDALCFSITGFHDLVTIGYSKIIY